MFVSIIVRMEKMFLEVHVHVHVHVHGVID